MKYVISAEEFLASANIIKAFLKETGMRSENMQNVLTLIKNQEWDKIPAEPGLTLVLSTPIDALGNRDLVEVIFEVDAKRNVQVMELMVPWVERLAPVGIAVWGLLKVFKNVLDTMREDVLALTNKWAEEDKAAASTAGKAPD